MQSGCFMHLLEGSPALDHVTLAQQLLAQTSAILYDLGDFSADAFFIDGTKIEAYANKLEKYNKGS